MVQSVSVKACSMTGDTDDESVQEGTYEYKLSCEKFHVASILLTSLTV